MKCHSINTYSSVRYVVRVFNGWDTLEYRESGQLDRKEAESLVAFWKDKKPVQVLKVSTTTDL